MVLRISGFVWIGAAVATLAMGGAHSLAVAQDSTSGQAGASSVDCTDVQVEFNEDPLLTREERLEAMNRAFLRSLSKFDNCQRANAAGGGQAGGASGAGGGSSGAGEGGGEMSGTEGGAAGDGLEAGRASVAASDMSGTEPVDTVEAAASQGVGDISGSDSTELSSLSTEDPAGVRGTGEETLENGRVPEDIPPAENDDVLAAQIRRAAMNEPDPEIREKLWDEYRNYKGLPAAE